MYNYRRPTATTLKVNNSSEGETIEEKVYRIVINKEPITEGMPTYYTERSEGVVAATNIRTDRFEVAIEAMDKVTGAKLAARERKQKDKLGEKAKEGMEQEQKNEINKEGGKPTSTQGTGE